MRTPDIVNMKFGSHLYGLNTPDSDLDYKGIYIPTLRELLLYDYPLTEKKSTGPEHEKNKAGDIDREVVSLPRFIEHACNGETFAIDMLHANEDQLIGPVSSIWKAMVKNRQRFYTSNLKGFMGYVKRQAAIYGIRGSRLGDVREAINTLNRLGNLPMGPRVTLQQVWPFLYEGEYAKRIRKTDNQNRATNFYEVNGKKYQDSMQIKDCANKLLTMYTQYGAKLKAAERNEGVEWKALSHALRAAYQVRDIYTKGDFEYPLKETEYLLSVKNGLLDYKTNVGPELEQIIAIVGELAEKTDLPQEVDREFWNGFLIGTYEQHFGIKVHS